MYSDLGSLVLLGQNVRPNRKRTLYIALVLVVIHLPHGLEMAMGLLVIKSNCIADQTKTN